MSLSQDYVVRLLIKSANEVGADVPSARCRGPVLHPARRGLGSSGILGKMRTHLVISLWFGIVCSLVFPTTLAFLASA